MICRKVAGVPESLLKKQKATEALAAKRAAERVALKKVYYIYYHTVVLYRCPCLNSGNLPGCERGKLSITLLILLYLAFTMEGNDDQKTKGLITEANFGWPYDWSIGVSELYHEHLFFLLCLGRQALPRRLHSFIKLTFASCL